MTNLSILIFILFSLPIYSNEITCKNTDINQISYINGFIDTYDLSVSYNNEVLDDLNIARLNYKFDKTCAKLYFNHNHGLFLNSLEFYTQIKDEINQEYSLDEGLITTRDIYQYLSYVMFGVNLTSIVSAKGFSVAAEPLARSLKDLFKKLSINAYKSYYEDEIIEDIDLEIDATANLMYEDLSKDLLVRNVLLISKDQGAFYANQIAD